MGHQPINLCHASPIAVGVPPATRPGWTCSSPTGESTPIPSAACPAASREGEAREIPSATPLFGKLGLPQARPSPSPPLISGQETP
ncbi:hypothetical protein TorRG33x02_109610, partial [Trema orientale]